MAHILIRSFFCIFPLPILFRLKKFALCTAGYVYVSMTTEIACVGREMQWVQSWRRWCIRGLLKLHGGLCVRFSPYVCARNELVNVCMCVRVSDGVSERGRR